jgi:hypothetical protein
MTREEAIKAVHEVLREIIPTLETIDETLDMQDDLGLLELDLIEAQLMFEEKFSIQLSDEETDAIGRGNYRIGDWVDRILRVQAQQKQQTKEST